MGRPGCDLALKAVHIVHRTRNGFRAGNLSLQVAYNRQYLYSLIPRPDMKSPATLPHFGALASGATTEAPASTDSADPERRRIVKTRFEVDRQPSNLPIAGAEWMQRGNCFSFRFLWDWIGYIYPSPSHPYDTDAIIAAIDILAVIMEWEGYPVRQHENE